jgi:hypothetical protein
MVRKTEENVIQRIFLRNTVPALCAVRKTEENGIQRIFLRNTVPVLCAAMECRQVSTLEHEGERCTCIVCSEKMIMECRQVSTLEHEGER